MKAKKGDKDFNATPLNLMRGLVTAILVVSVLAMFTAVASATDYYVRTGGLDDTSRDGLANTDDQAWKTISYAISRAEVTAGDTIHVAAGEYSENVDVNKAHLTLQGEGRDVVTVTAQSAGDHVFEVTKDYVSISGFTVTGATGGAVAGIHLRVRVDHCSISDNNVSDNCHGIWLYYSCSNTLTNNIANSNTGHGICLDYLSNYNTLTGNTANSNSQYGIYLYNADDNKITCNWVAHNDQRGFYLLGGSTGNTIEDNNIITNGVSQGGDLSLPVLQRSS
jgi:parallel beta-helix repeat protein